MTERRSFSWLEKILIPIVTAGIISVGASIATSEIAQQRQDDNIRELQRRVELLEGIAKVNSESRIKVETTLTIIMKQHEEMKDKLDKIHATLTEHERRGGR